MLAPNRLIQGTAARVQSLPAPIGGWNVRDSIANMDTLDAVTLTNFFPTVNNVVLRGGYTQYSTGITGQVQTLLSYSSGASDKLFAIAWRCGFRDLSYFNRTFKRLSGISPAVYRRQPAQCAIEK